MYPIPEGLWWKLKGPENILWLQDNFQDSVPPQTHLEAHVPRAPWTEGKLAWRAGQVSGSHSCNQQLNTQHLSQVGRTPGAILELQTLTSSQESWGRAQPQQTGMGSESGGEQGREGPHREWQHFYKHKHPWISTRMGPKQSSPGPGQESKAVPQGRRAPYPTAQAGESWHSTSPVGKAPAPQVLGQTLREQEPARRRWSLPGQTLARPHCTHLVPRWGPHFNRSLRQREKSLFSLAHRRLEPSESCLQLHQDGSCKDSADKCFQPWQTGQGRAVATKGTMEFSGWTQWQSFSLKGGEEQAQVSHGGHGFAVLGGFHGFRVKVMTYLTHCYFYPCFEWVVGPETPRSLFWPFHLQHHNLINSCDILPTTTALII